jgi:hypothetical protein
MPRPAFTESQPPSSYEAAGRRLQALIASPGVQKVQVVAVCRLDHESPDDWKRLLDEIGETAGVRVEALDLLTDPLRLHRERWRTITGVAAFWR